MQPDRTPPAIQSPPRRSPQDKRTVGKIATGAWVQNEDCPALDAGGAEVLSAAAALLLGDEPEGAAPCRRSTRPRWFPRATPQTLRDKGKSEAGALLPAGWRSCQPAEFLEQLAQVLGRWTPIPVSDTAIQTAALRGTRRVSSPARSAGSAGAVHRVRTALRVIRPSSGRELRGVGQQIEQNLPYADLIGHDHERAASIRPHCCPWRTGDWSCPRPPPDRVAQVGRARCTVIRPASILERSRTLLISPSRCCPFRASTPGNPAAASSSSASPPASRRSENPMMALSGVLSSWDMLARNSLFSWWPARAPHS